MRKRINYWIWSLAQEETVTPQLYKEKLIKKFGKEYNINFLIETGTYEGETINAVKNSFHKILSLEKDPDLWSQAKERFKEDKHIDIACGDSAEILPPHLLLLAEPTLFWLDAHYSGGKTARGPNPLLTEVRVIVDNFNKHVILIDDADFNWKYVSRIRKIVEEKYNFKIKNNIMEITPK